MKLLTASCSKNTWSTYDSQFNGFIKYCNLNNYSYSNVSIDIVLSYLTSIYESGLSYSAINTARSALSLLLPPIEGYSIGQHPLVTRLLKGVIKQRPPTPKYSHTWNVDQVLDKLRGMPSNDKLELSMLSIKLVGLLALISGQRVQTLAAIKLENIKCSTNMIRIFIPDNLKTSGKNVCQPCIVLPEFKKNKKLCVKFTLEEYLNRTKKLRKDEYLFISIISPYKKVTSQTISKWLVKLLDMSDVDTTIYKSHSFRHSSTSKAFRKGVNINSIYCNAGWSAKSKVFGKFYNKPCDDINEFAYAVLNK